MSRVRGRGRSIGDRLDEAPRPRRHDVDDVGQDHRLGDRVGDQEGGRVALQADPLQLHVHEVAAEFVEGAERLVEQQHRRLGDQHPADRGALRHAAGQLARIDVLEAFQPDEVEELRGAWSCLARAAALPSRISIGSTMFSMRRAPREQGRLLEHHADVPARPDHRLAGQNDAARTRAAAARP